MVLLDEPAPARVAGAGGDCPPRPWWRRWGARLAAPAVGGWLALVLAHHAFSGRWWLWLIPDALPPVAYAVVPLVLLGLVAAARCGGRRRLAAGAVLALLLGVGDAGLHPAALIAADVPAPAGAVRVFGWNTEHWHQDEPAGALHAHLRGQDADVLVLQEYLHRQTGGQRLRVPVDDLAGLRATFPGREIVVRGELVTVSRWPVLSARVLGPGAAVTDADGFADVFRSVRVLRTDLRVGGRTLSVYNVHLPVQFETLNPADPLFWTHPRTAAADRAAQLDALTADVAANPHPVLVVGDFNATGAMGELDRLRGLLHDPATVPYPASWPAALPLWRLDWALTARLSTHEHRFGDAAGLSDHLPQHLTLTLPE